MISPFDLLFTYCESTDVVLWRVNLPSNVGVSRFSPLISSIVNLSIPNCCWFNFMSKFLLNVLMIKYRLNCTLRQTKSNQY